MNGIPTWLQNATVILAVALITEGKYADGLTGLSILLPGARAPAPCRCGTPAFLSAADGAGSLMPRAMSFGLTERAFVLGEKDVTRRLGWLEAREGDVYMGVRKCMGLAKGERQHQLGATRVVSVRRERLDTITADDVRREGFADWTPEDFVAFFCKANKCEPTTVVTRIQFEKVR